MKASFLHTQKYFKAWLGRDKSATSESNTGPKHISDLLPGFTWNCLVLVGIFYLQKAYLTTVIEKDQIITQD